ncbi:MAG: tRNA epoxyqueuosine(34) reductase QueG, partial [Chloroflexota bacterium]
DPRLIFPECKTILVAALPYPAGNTTGPVADYALGDDYHDVIPRQLRELVAWLESETGRPIAHRIYTDTGPLLERELAQRAGLGWIGKNTMLINPRAGSYFLLGEALIDLELPPDPPFAADHCGTCTRCMDACPTGAILDGRALDARRCISYLTIELKDSIPEELREKTGSWIFGCDICQAVCPWNVRFAATLAPDAALAPHHPSPNLAAELSLTAEQFNAKFKGSPIKRARRRGYLRNVAVALGNTGGAGALPALEKCLDSETDPLVREHVEWGARKIELQTPNYKPPTSNDKRHA